ncbi:hypothetical protein EDD11_003659 [Mortierella claussenii]|nr:hypothetical protein EDD11_003659 [Mortierella claussenii]
MLCALFLVSAASAQKGASTRALLTTADASTTATNTAPSLPTTTTSNFILPTGTGDGSGATAPPATPSPSSGPGTEPGSNSSLTQCPSPLIPNIHNLDIPTCIGPCCVRCPAVNSFYEPGKVENVLHAAYILRQVSLGFAIFMAVSYLTLPGKRSQPHISVLFLTISLALWYAAFDIMPGISNACINDFEESTGKNSKLCGVQGVLIIYLTQTSALWCSLLIYKLHLLAVWRSNIIDRYYAWLTGFCWIFPLAFAIPVAAKNLSQYPGIGFSCLVSNDNLNTYLFYPLAVYIYPAILCHLFTVGKMIHLAILSSNVDAGLSQLSSNARMRLTTTMQAKRLLRGQWRPALMLCTIMVSFTIFWLFYFVGARQLAHLGPHTEWIQHWLICVASNNVMLPSASADEIQTICAREIVHNLPSIPWFTAAEILLALIGIVVAMVFVSKTEFWSDWIFLLKNLIRRGKLGRAGSRKRGSPEIDKAGNNTDQHCQPQERYAQHVLRHQFVDPNIRKGTRVGYNDALPAEMSMTNENKSTLASSDYPFRNVNEDANHLNSNNGHQHAAQWYNMDDLLDKEYGMQQQQLQQQESSDLHRNQSFGSRVGMTSTPLLNNSVEPPLYLRKTKTSESLHEPHSGDILYSPPVQERDDYYSKNTWVPSTHATVTTPSKAYLVANDSSDRYVDQPVVPLPVPRASLKAKGNQQPKQQQSQEQPVFLSSPTHSPTFVQTSLSPMPPKSALSYHQSLGQGHGQKQPPMSGLPRPVISDSVPIVSGVRGSPAVAPVPGLTSAAATASPTMTASASPAMSTPSALSPLMSNDPNKTAGMLYNLDDDTDKIMVASRASISGSHPHVIGRSDSTGGGGQGATRGVASKATWKKQSSDALTARSNTQGSGSAGGVKTTTKAPIALDLTRIKSPAPPTIPLKSPARKSSLNRQQQQGQGHDRELSGLPL